VRSLRARFIIAEGAAAAAINEIRNDIPSVEAIIGVGDGHGFETDYEELTARGSAAEPAATVTSDDLLTIKFTSGTTGVPKGCVRTHGNFIAAATGNIIEVPIDERDTAIVSAPLAAGMAISQMTMLVMRGVRIIMLRRFEPEAFLDALDRERPTLVYLMDGMSRRLFAHPAFASADLSSIRLYHPVNMRDVAERLHAHPTFGGGFSSGYASSEGGGLISVKKPELYQRGLGDPGEAHLLDCLGHETLLNRIECLDDDLNPVPAGEIGELAIRGPSVFQGYWENPEETAKVLRGGWLLTGDLACRNADGFIYLRGRKRDLIRSGNLSVYPSEVEPVLLASGKVSVACVIGIPDLEWGEKVVACAVRKSSCTEDELINFCRQQLAPYKCPKAVVFFDNLPTTDVGKIDKKELARTVMQLQQRPKMVS
jgi:acyl-CoA synthetase (AMP-forming)/AMP-acid ligase II